MDTDGLEAYADELFRAALRICGNWNDAEDLAQETLLAALQYDGAPADRRAWLHGVLCHKHYDLLRRKYRLPTVSIDLVPDMPETGAEPETFLPLGKLLPAPGCYGETLHLFLAKGLKFSQQQLDPDEFLNVERVPFDEMVHRCVNGEIDDAKTVAAVLRAKVLLNL